jgi:hypothetical protein
MSVKPPFDLLALFARFGREQKVSLRDPQSLETFLAVAKDALGSAVNIDTLMQGQRTENMFAAMVLSLGQYELLNREDSGATHPSDQFQAPDFRVVLNDDAQWLVEVKNFYDAEPGQQVFTVKEDYLQRLQRYADAMQCPLKLAIYWARWRFWSLLDPNDLQPQNGKRTIAMPEAMRLSQMAALGDRTIGTTPPLKLRLNVDTSKPRHVEADGQVRFTIADGALYSGEKRITDPAEQKIAWMLVELGEWECGDPTAHISAGQLDAIEFEWTPEEQLNPGEKFELIGTLSTMFAPHYGARTLDQQKVVQTEIDMVPDWFMPLVAADPKSMSLPLWRFVLQPNKPKAVGSKSAEDSQGIDENSS